MQTTVQDKELQSAVDSELAIGDRRSMEYRLGMLDVLRLKALGAPIPRRYAPGTVQFDAYHAGNGRGHILWRDMHAPVSDNRVL